MISRVLGKVLIVDDQKNWRQVLRTLLELEGCEVSEAATYEEAKKQLKDTGFDLTVLDVRLIDHQIFNVQGLELLHFIKTNHPTTKTIVLTSYDESAKNAESEADVLLSKGKGEATFDSKKFRNHVRELLAVPIK